jgi:hypothetical protein
MVEMGGASTQIGFFENNGDVMVRREEFLTIDILLSFSKEMPAFSTSIL